MRSLKALFSQHCNSAPLPWRRIRDRYLMKTNLRGPVSLIDEEEMLDLVAIAQSCPA